MPVYNPPVAPSLTILGTPTKVYDGAATGAFVDVDCSSVVGANEALLLVRITNLSGGASTIAARRNGDTITVSDPSVPTSECVYLTVDTDSSGIFEFSGSNVANTHEVHILSWLKE